MSSSPIVLVHGGLNEDMDADRFWVQPGVVEALEERGHRVLAVDRPRLSRSWQEEARSIDRAIHDAGFEAVAVVAGSNGCSAAVRVALDSPGLVRRLVLCWPATRGDDAVDERYRRLIESHTGPEAGDRLLSGGAIRGVTDEELQLLDVPVGIVPSEPESPFHRHATAMALDRLIPDSTLATGWPETPRPEFASIRAEFVDTLTALLG